MAATVLYLNAGDHELEWPRKLAGIRRYAKAQGWRVEAFRRRDVPARDVPALLRRCRPSGCIVEDTDPGLRLPPRLFGALPVAYLDSSAPEERRGLPLVLCDHEAVAERAFRELSTGDPPCFAVVPSPSFVSWNALRIRAFEARCARAGRPCRVFSGFANEDAGRRTERLSSWLASLPPHAAVFAANDRAAKDVATAAAAVRRRFPRDYTLLGVDATPETFADSTTPGISSVELDFELAGYLAAKALEGEMSRKDDHGNPGPAFGPLLVVRKESTRGRGRRERHVLEAVEKAFRAPFPRGDGTRNPRRNPPRPPPDRGRPAFAPRPPDLFHPGFLRLRNRPRTAKTLPRPFRDVHAGMEGVARAVIFMLQKFANGVYELLH